MEASESICSISVGIILSYERIEKTIKILHYGVSVVDLQVEEDFVVAPCQLPTPTLIVRGREGECRGSNVW